jgi:tRNA-dihydrouridine synthase
MKNFSQRYFDLQKDSIKYITEFLEQHENKFIMATEEDMEDEDFFERAWEFPQATYVGKHDYTYYYAIYKVALEDGKVFFHGISINDENRDQYVFGVAEVDLACLVDAAALMEGEVSQTI